jgi:hypothetical protein
MNTNSPNWLQWATGVLVVVAVIFGILAYNNASNIEVPTASEIASQVKIPEIPAAPVIDIPTAEEIASKIVIPTPVTSEIDTAKIDKICEATEGCEFWSGSVSDLYALNNNEAADDFIDRISDLIGLDTDEFRINGVLAKNLQASDLTYGDVSYKDAQIRAYSDRDKDKENWELKVFLRIKYHDMDADFGDKETIYVVITSVLDEGEYNSLSITEVNRHFEFE